MDLLSLISKIKDGNIEPVYLVQGLEFFIIDQFVSVLKETVVQGAMADFNYDRKKASETSGAEIVAESRSMPMMAAKRLLIIDDADKLKAADQTMLDPYLADPAPETCLVLIGTKFDLRKGMFSRANRRKQVHKADALLERQIGNFISHQATQRNVKFSPSAKATLAAAVGPDCAALDDAIERAGLYAGEGETVSETDITEVVTTGRQHSVFDLVDAIGNRHQSKAISLLEEFLDRREEPIRLNALLARHIRQLLGARMLDYQNMDDVQISKKLGVPPFVAKKLVAQSRQFKGSQLEVSLGRLAKTDLELKSSKRSSGLVLEQAVMDLCFSK